MTEIKIRNFKEISYDELEELNLAVKHEVLAGTPHDELKARFLKHLQEERQIKAVTVCFSDIEGRFHMLDYDKKHLLASHEGLTFDGSSIRGFSIQSESDLRLDLDWSSFRWLPSDVFGPGKVLLFAFVCDRDGSPYAGDFRGRLRGVEQQLAERGQASAAAFEIEGFLFKGINAEQSFDPNVGFEFVSEGGYFHSLPVTPLKAFIDHFAEAQRALGFENEKDHPEVAPSQFELNYAPAPAVIAADQVQLYKLLARQIATSMGFTASFLPKPRTAINGSGMHTNLSISSGERNLMFDPQGTEQLSSFAWSFVDNILQHALDLCLIMNPSVNAYRRLDPHYEAPNQVRVSAVDRSAMIRIPLGTPRSARIEIRSVAPDANPYLLLTALLSLGMQPTPPLDTQTRQRRDLVLPSHIQEALTSFEASTHMARILGEEPRTKYAALKRAAAQRSPHELGTRIKSGEVLFHHEVTNQYIWSRF
ncbi:MAG: glutamine synthetase family protein [Myxococcota bacterium]|jgi:glutamine synthetase|nr:glutamine synthetase family protein [Myxococcota bacterium]